MPPRVAFVAAMALFLQAAPGRAQHDDEGLPEGGEGEDCTLGIGPVAPARDLTCTATLVARGANVHELATVEGVTTPLELGAPLAGVTVRSHGRRAAPELSIADCRLLSALLTWIPELSRLGVVGIEHLSIYRSGARVAGSGRPSGHSHGLAIDLSHLVFSDGTTFEVETDWVNRTRGEDPCVEHADESERMRGIRAAVCAASRSGLFQVVLTPHADDAHGNHVHLEVRPDVTWTILR